jgi:archaeal type IV pilus assembly protein PilA
LNENRLSASTKKRAISPIIATLLLILIAIAAGTIVYAYVIGFIGSSTGNGGGNQSVLQVSNFCASASTKCNSIDAYTVTILNKGSTSISTGTFQLYFTDSTSGNSGTGTCTISSAIAPGASQTCSSTTWPSGLTAPNAPGAGDSMSVKVVAPDGGSTTSSAKAIS